jgi:hypothetical protein
VRILLPSLPLVAALACGPNTTTCPCRQLPEKAAKEKAPEPSQSAGFQGAPREPTSPEPSARATPTADENVFGAEPESKMFIEYVVGDEHRILSGACRPRWEGENSDGHRGPYAEILDPDSATPRFILDSCGADGVYFSVVGTTLELPGRVKVMELRFQGPKPGQEWTSAEIELQISEFGAVGEPVRGTFRGMMSPRLNRPAVPIRGRFRTSRARDRFAP